MLKLDVLGDMRFVENIVLDFGSSQFDLNCLAANLWSFRFWTFPENLIRDFLPFRESLVSFAFDYNLPAPSHGTAHFATYKLLVLERENQLNTNPFIPSVLRCMEGELFNLKRDFETQKVGV